MRLPIVLVVTIYPPNPTKNSRPYIRQIITTACLLAHACLKLEAQPPCRTYLVHAGLLSWKCMSVCFPTSWAHEWYIQLFALRHKAYSQLKTLFYSDYSEPGIPCSPHPLSDCLSAVQTLRVRSFDRHGWQQSSCERDTDPNGRVQGLLVFDARLWRLWRVSPGIPGVKLFRWLFIKFQNTWIPKSWSNCVTGGILLRDCAAKPAQNWDRPPTARSTENAKPKPQHRKEPQTMTLNPKPCSPQLARFKLATFAAGGDQLCSTQRGILPFGSWGVGLVGFRV